MLGPPNGSINMSIQRLFHETQLREYTLCFLHIIQTINDMNLVTYSKPWFIIQGVNFFLDFYSPGHLYMYLQECNKNNISWFLVEGLAVCRTPVATKKRFSFTTCFSKNLNKKHPLIRDPFLCSKFTSSNSLLSQKNDLMSQTPPKKKCDLKKTGW